MKYPSEHGIPPRATAQELKVSRRRLKTAHALLEKTALRQAHLIESERMARARASAAEARARKQQSALRANEQFTQRVLQSSSDCIKILDLEGRLLFINSPGRRLLEITDLAKLLNTSWIDFWEGENREAARKALASAQSGQEGRFQGFAPTMKGKPKWWDVIVTPIVSPAGKPEQLLSISRDITASKEAERQVMFHSTLLESMNESGLEGILIVSPQGRLLYFNQRFVEMWGFPSSVLRSRSDRDALRWAAQQMQRPKDFLRKVRAAYQDQSVNVREEIRLKDGRIFDRYGTPARSKDGMDYGWVWFFRDVTEQKAAESALHAATEQVRHYARELENRVESRTADLNAANTRLKALSRRLVDLQEAERRRIARELHDQIGQQLTGLKLLLGRDAGSERGQTAAVKEARLVVLDLVQQVRQICLDLRPQVLDDLGLLIALKWHFKTYRRQTGITVRFRYRGFDESKVSRDKGIAVFRIVQEALTNVARHAKVRTVFVQVSTSRGSLCVRVEDEGVGYNPRAMGHRAGSGLGTMRERVAIAGGTIKVTARRHAGCRIQVETPLGGESLSS